MTALVSEPVAFLIGMFVVVILWALFCAGDWR